MEKSKQIPILEDLLRRKQEEFIQNYLVEGCFLVNIYLPKRLFTKFKIGKRKFNFKENFSFWLIQILILLRILLTLDIKQL